MDQLDVCKIQRTTHVDVPKLSQRVDATILQRRYPTTQVIIDATVFFIEKPSSLARQSATWSSYKNHNTFKVLIGVPPDGTMVFIGNLYEESVSDVDLVS